MIKQQETLITSTIIIINIIVVVSFNMYKLKQLSPQIDQYNQQKENYNKQVQELITTFNNTIDEKGLNLEKINIEEYQYITDFIDKTDYSLFQSLGAFKNDYTPNNILLSEQNCYLNMFYKMLSQVNGCQNFVFVGQVIPILKQVFDGIYAVEYQRNGYLEMNGAKYVKLNGQSTVENTQLQPQWSIYYTSDSHVPNFNNKQIVGNQLKNTSSLDFYNMSFNEYKDQSVKVNGSYVQKPVLKNPESNQNDPKNNQYTLDFNNNALPAHEHKIYEFTKQTRTILDNKMKTGKWYTQNQPEDNINEMDVEYTSTLKSKHTEVPPDYPAVLNVSDPCVDVYYLLCVSV